MGYLQLVNVSDYLFIRKKKLAIPFVASAVSSFSVGTASGTSTASAVTFANYFSSGTASATSTASAVSFIQDSSVGTASATSSASAITFAKYFSSATASASSTAAGVIFLEDSASGTASGTSSASGNTFAKSFSSGTASGTSSASATSFIEDSSTGTASGTSTASGVGTSISLTYSTGTASGTSTASGVGSRIVFATSIVNIPLVGTSNNEVEVTGINMSTFNLIGSNMSSAQNISFPQFQNSNLIVTMLVPTDITGWTILLNIRTPQRTLLLQIPPTAITDEINGVFNFDLTSAQTGLFGVSLLFYDVWRVDAGAETQLCVGNLNITSEQWM